ncbi:MAG TPA: exodeoxyribonuclease VII large subunit, partial [Hyphomicrobiaceae bacterium]|nr:exodeoxyribonuclease VII large subunit [Hyphomicrobiaceae bacterium]
VPKHGDLVERLGDLALRLTKCVHRAIETARTHLKAAARGLPRLEDLLALPRQRFDSIERRLARALDANTQAHGKRLARIEARFQPRLVAQLLQRDRQRLDRAQRAGLTALARRTSTARTRFERFAARHTPHAIHHRVGRLGERMVDVSRRLSQAFAGRLMLERRALDAHAQVLASLSYQSVLRRGFAVVRDADGRAVRSAGSLAVDARIGIELADGRAGARVTSIETSDDRPPEPPKPRTPKRSGPDGQGSLF